MDLLGQGQDRSACAAIRFDDERPLLSNSSLSGGMIERENGGHLRAEVPGDFSTAMMEARVVAIEHQVHVVTIDAQLAFELIERGPRVP